MKIKLVHCPSWMVSSSVENRPSLQAFNFIKTTDSWSEIEVEAETIGPFNSTHMIVQTDGDLSKNFYNLAYFVNEDGLTPAYYYLISDITVVQEQETGLFITHLSLVLEVYYTFLLSYFDETWPINNQEAVFFIQKHMVRHVFPNGSTGGWAVNFEQQFYLKQHFSQLDNLSTNSNKVTYVANWRDYNNGGWPANVPQYHTMTMTNFAISGSQNYYIGSFMYMLTKISPSLGKMGDSSYIWYPYWGLSGYIGQAPTLAAVAVGSTGSYIGDNCGTIPWWFVIQNIGSKAYADFVVFPVPLQGGLVIKQATNGQTGPVYPSYIELNQFAPSTWENNNYSYIWTSNGAGFVQSSNFDSFIGSARCYPASPYNYHYVFTTDPSNISNTQIYKLFFNIKMIFILEPAIISYCNWRVRGAGEDSFVDLTLFNNWNPYSVIQTLCSFQININHPITQITNISFNTLYYINGFGTPTSGNNNPGVSLYESLPTTSNPFNIALLSPYSYNKYNDVYWCLNWKEIYPSASDNWNNYLLGNLNQYHTALNIAHLGLQQAACSAVLGSLGAGFSWFDGVGMFESGLVNQGIDDYEKLALTNRLVEYNKANYMSLIGQNTPFATYFHQNDRMYYQAQWAQQIHEADKDKRRAARYEPKAPVYYQGLQAGMYLFSAGRQYAHYKYLVSGMKQDMSRTSNQRLATNNNVTAYDNAYLSFTFESPVQYELVSAINYYALNGYLLNKWIPWGYWNNRQYCNFVKCAYFTDVMMSLIESVYKDLIDGLLNAGIRIWNVKYVNDFSDNLNINCVLINSIEDNSLSGINYPNYEIDPQGQAQQELTWINGKVSQYE